MSPASWFLLLALAVMVGCLAVCFLIFTRQRDLWGEVNQLKEILQAFISIQERNIIELRTEIKSMGGLARENHVGRPADRNQERESFQGDAPGKDSSIYAESQEKAQRRRFVWELADQGLSMEEIARRTQLPLGQVDVILNMRGVTKESGKNPWR